MGQDTRFWVEDQRFAEGCEIGTHSPAEAYRRGAAAYAGLIGMATEIRAKQVREAFAFLREVNQAHDKAQGRRTQ